MVLSKEACLGALILTLNLTHTVTLSLSLTPTLPLPPPVPLTLPLILMGVAEDPCLRGLTGSDTAYTEAHVSVKWQGDLGWDLGHGRFVVGPEGREGVEVSV